MHPFIIEEIIVIPNNESVLFQELFGRSYHTIYLLVLFLGNSFTSLPSTERNDMHVSSHHHYLCGPLSLLHGMAGCCYRDVQLHFNLD